MLDWKARRAAEIALDSALARDEQERAPNGQFGAGSGEALTHHKNMHDKHGAALADARAKGDKKAAAEHLAAKNMHVRAHKAHKEVAEKGSGDFAASSNSSRANAMSKKLGIV